MTTSANIVLIGYRGSGKSTVGRLLADLRQCPWVDSDELIARQAGRTIAEIFAAEGEAGFRNREQVALGECLAADGQVVSVGGGAVELPANRDLLRRRGTVVWLQAGAEWLAERILGDPESRANRPALLSGGLEEVRAVLARRTPLYAATAHHQLNVEVRSPENVAAEIERILGAGEQANSKG